MAGATSCVSTNLTTNTLLDMPPRQRAHRHRPITAATIAGVLSFVLPTMNLIRLCWRRGSLVPFAYHLGISGVTFLFYGYDKMQARNLEWRVKEVTLHMLELLGGWPGALIGQHFFQHKTRKTAFQIPFWMIVAGWQVAWCVVWRRGVRVHQ
jgi:uncharacterized membrane protein YsdA (DUF1294 family)